MYYVCIENEQLISVLNYEPSVPNSVVVVPISDTEYLQWQQAKTHEFDVANRRIVSCSQAQLDANTQEKQNIEYQRYLNTSDWKVLRHIREKALGMPTSISESEYLDLELARHRAAQAIKH